jgi:FAD binding domain/Berberine and berberine like
MAMLQQAAVSRRRFLVGSSALALGLGAGRRLVEPALAQTVVRQPSEPAWRELAAKISGPVLRANSFDLSKIASPYNLRYAGDLPDGIALCRTASDVAAAVTWCNQNRFPLVVQSGGHSYAGCSMRKGGLMIHLLLMRSAKIEGGKATIAGGVRNQELYALLAQNGAAITHGRCPTVGAAGFLLGGGIGFNMRAYGAACDQLAASEIVTADGEIRTITPRGDKLASDLFWACRGGGGGNFGISTSFTLNLFEAEPVTVFDLTWSSANPEKVAAALMTSLESAPLDTGLGTRVSLKARSPLRRSRGENVLINVIGQLRRNAKTLDDILAPAFETAKPQQSMIWSDAPYWQAQKLLEDDDGPAFFQERSAFAAPGQAVHALDVAFRYLHKWPGTSGGGDLRFFQTGGKMNETPAGATAFVHRASAWLMDVGLSWTKTDPPRIVDQSRVWQDDFYKAIRPFSTGAAYQNFIDPSLGDWRKAYYGENLERLEAIKKAADPHRLFAFPQGI